MSSVTKNNLSKQIKQIWRNEYYLDKEPEILKIDPNLKKNISNLFSPGPNFFLVFNFQEYDYDFVDPGIKDILGYDHREFNLEKMISIIHPEDIPYVPIVEQMAVDFIHKEIPADKIKSYKVSYDSRISDIHGNTVHVLKQAIAYDVDETGKVTRVLSIYADITHLKKPHDHSVSFIGLNGEPSYFGLEPDPKLVKKFIGKDPLTQREREVVKLLSMGLNSKEIADELFVTEETIKSHRKNLLKKLDKKNVTQLVVHCIQYGII